MFKRRTRRTAGGRAATGEWKIDRKHHAVLVYAQPGNAAANVLTDMTFASGRAATATGGQGYRADDRAGSPGSLDPAAQLARFGRAQVEPQHVFELHFEGIAESPRTRAASRCGSAHRPVATDKKPSDADTLQSLRALIRRRSGAR